MLAEVPSEILSHIAYHLCSSDLSPPVNLLQTCRTIYESICPRSNPRLYSKLFKEAFDIGAVERRLEGDELHALHISLELERRVKCLNRLKKMITRGNVIDVTMDDLWVIYIMLIENDGKNIQHFTDGSIDLYTFLRLYHEQCLLVVAVQPGYPKETPERGLIMWIAWLLSGYESTRKIHPESIEERQERLFILRPYVFAPHEYELCFAPWTISHLPIHEAATRRNEHHPFGADLTPKIKTVTVGYYGKVLDISGPLLSHAAILRFFVQRPENGSISDDEILSPFQALLGRRMGRNVGISNQLETPMRESDDGSDVDSDDGDETFGAIRDLISDSKNHDRDFKRLLSCHDPFRCAGMKRSAWRGSFQGCWEGNFSFFDLEAFRDMLNGNSRALYEGSFGEQAQVWRIIETWVWTSDYGSRKRRQRQKEREEREKKRKEREALGEVVSDDEVMVDKGKGRAKGLPLTGPATNAGFPTNLPSSTLAGLATPAAEAITLNETIKQQVEAVKGYEIVPESEMEEVLSSPDGGEAAGLEMILTGVGHSAWGRFILKGKVRAWDGMASLVKEYAVSSDSRGKWIYRGYVVSGDIFVGRWRDTFTPEEYIGYEGTFVLHRR